MTTSRKRTYDHKSIIYAIMGGAMVGFGGTVLLSVDNPYLGAFLFAGALFIILSLKYSLFTGMVGYLFYYDKKEYTKKLFIALIGNLIGTFAIAMLMRQTRFGPALIAQAQLKTGVKLNDSPQSLFILAFFCNMFVTNAVHQFKYNRYQVGKYLAIFISIMTFVLSGFEHSIADSFFFFLAGEFNLLALRNFFLILVANILGGLVIPTLSLMYDDTFSIAG